MYFVFCCALILYLSQMSLSATAYGRSMYTLGAGVAVGGTVDLSLIHIYKGLAVDRRSMKQLESNDLLPFKAGIDAGAPAVLVSHNIVKAIDDNLPASLSPAVHRLLREKLDFGGVIITDDLSMDAIDNYFPETNSAVTAILAGNDILCTGNYKNQYAAVLDAVKKGDISENRIDTSVKKILRWKINLKLINTNRQESADK